MKVIHEKCDIPFERQVNEVLWFFIMKNYGEGDSNIENGIFALRSYNWVDSDDEDEDLNEWHFWHKPSGFKLQWYKYPLRGAYVNMEITYEEFYAILQDTMNSVRGYKDCTFTPWWKDESAINEENIEEEYPIEELKQEILDFCEELGAEETLLFENPGYETAFIGLDTNYRAIYSHNKMVEFLMKVDGMTEEEAIEFIDYNTIRACAYMENAPIILESEF